MALELRQAVPVGSHGLLEEGDVGVLLVLRTSCKEAGGAEVPCGSAERRSDALQKRSKSKAKAGQGGAEAAQKRWRALQKRWRSGADERERCETGP